MNLEISLFNIMKLQNNTLFVRVKYGDKFSRLGWSSSKDGLSLNPNFEHVPRSSLISLRRVLRPNEGGPGALLQYNAESEGKACARAN